MASPSGAESAFLPAGLAVRPLEGKAAAEPVSSPQEDLALAVTWLSEAVARIDRTTLLAFSVTVETQQQPSLSDESFWSDVQGVESLALSIEEHLSNQ